MANTRENVLVFGPTGAVGGAVAREANRRGAKVWLAMRTVSKAIDGLSQEEEKQGDFVRIQADLSKPDTLKAAVAKSGAHIAFVYTLFEPGSETHMLDSFKALKESGITWVVLLSAFSVQGEASDESNQYHVIQRLHALTETALDSTGLAYVAIRPAYFNSNMLFEKDEISKGEIKLLYPKATNDYIATSDIGEICAAFLVDPALQKRYPASKFVYLCGPELIPAEVAYQMLGQALGRQINTVEVTEKEWMETHDFMPELMKKAALQMYRSNAPPNSIYPPEVYKEAVQNLHMYLDRKPTKLADWLEAHKGAFA